jgi:beta-lactam-binding protein with PASTA domain/predicted Ser/Thr protein kinase
MSGIAPGTLIDDRYEVRKRIGAGGMADVYLAKDTLLGRDVAVKLLHHRFVEDQEFVERFRREASAAASLSHPNVVAIFDRGSWDGTYYIAMEYLPGRTLKQAVRESGPLPPAAAVEIVIEILHAASFAHRRGIVHRDIKPHNVILGEEGRVTVTDFGIARAGASDMTHTGSIMGTAQYLSPEQAQGHPVSAASDIYAVGVLLYELLTGSVPFDADSAVAIALQHLSAPPPAPSSVNPAVPAQLDAIVARALAKEPAERYASADELIGALEEVRRALPPAEESVAHGARIRSSAPRAVALAGVAGAAAALAGEGAAQAPASNGGDGEAAAGAVASAPGEGGPVAVGPAAGGPFQPDHDGHRPQRRRRWWWTGAAALLVAAAVVLALELLPAGAEVTLPPLAGKSRAAAASWLRHHGLVPVAQSQASVDVPAGVVIAERPAAGSVVEEGTRVYLTVSTGAAIVAVPRVAGMPEPAAIRALEERGLKPDVQPQQSSRVRAGIVISTNPSAGIEALQGTPVTVYVSSGPPGASAGNVKLVHVPNVTGLSRAGAASALAAAGLTVGSVAERGTTVQPQGTVISQLPVAGASLAPGGAVNLVIAQSPTQVAVPNVIGKSETAAAAALGAAGLTPTSTTQTVTNPSENGIVLEQTPAAGRKLKRGATVALVVGALAQGQPTTTSTAAEGTGGAHGP